MARSPFDWPTDLVVCGHRERRRAASASSGASASGAGEPSRAPTTQPQPPETDSRPMRATLSVLALVSRLLGKDRVMLDAADAWHRARDARASSEIAATV